MGCCMQNSKLSIPLLFGLSIIALRNFLNMLPFLPYITFAFFYEYNTDNSGRQCGGRPNHLFQVRPLMGAVMSIFHTEPLTKVYFSPRFRSVLFLFEVSPEIESFFLDTDRIGEV